MPWETNLTGQSHSQREIFAITGLPPEVLAVALAKYSRSPLSVKEIINELTEEKSAEFHEKWVLGYGDASVADMAMVAVAIENVSILASKAIEDNRIASFQEKSTRYQIFDTSRFYRPASVMNDERYGIIYKNAIEFLMKSYAETVELMMSYYRRKYPQPSDMKDWAYNSKVKARSCDVARYILPVATLTNLGLMMSARALRHAIAKLKGNAQKEIQEIGQEIQRAAIEHAYNPQVGALEVKFDQLLSDSSSEQRILVESIMQTVKLQVKGAPTLIKRTDAKNYLLKKDQIVRRLASFYQPKDRADLTSRVDYIEDPSTHEDQLVASLLYRGSRRSYRQIQARLQGMANAEKEIIIDQIQQERDQWDSVSREFEIPGPLVFDTLMDYGAYRDLQRHRVCTQINQELWIDMGYEMPRDLDEAGGLPVFTGAMQQAKWAIERLAEKYHHESQYLIPMAYRKRTLFRMNLREFYHIVELRTKAGGHFSYRSLVYNMYEQYKAKHPMLAKHIRAVKMDFEKEFFER